MVITDCGSVFLLFHVFLTFQQKSFFTSKLCLQLKKTVFIFILLQNLLVVEFSCDYCYLLFVVLQFSL